MDSHICHAKNTLIWQTRSRECSYTISAVSNILDGGRSTFEPWGIRLNISSISVQLGGQTEIWTISLAESLSAESLLLGSPLKAGPASSSTGWTPPDESSSEMSTGPDGLSLAISSRTSSECSPRMDEQLTSMVSWRHCWSLSQNSVVKSQGGIDLSRVGSSTGTSARESGPQGGEPSLSTPGSSIGMVAGGAGSKQEGPTSSPAGLFSTSSCMSSWSGRGESGWSTEGSSSTGSANRSNAEMEGPDPYWPGTRLGRPDSLEEAKAEEGTGDRITIPLIGTIFFSQPNVESEEVKQGASHQGPSARSPPASSPLFG